MTTSRTSIQKQAQIKRKRYRQKSRRQKVWLQIEAAKLAWFKESIVKELKKIKNASLIRKRKTHLDSYKKRLRR